MPNRPQAGASSLLYLEPDLTLSQIFDVLNQAQDLLDSHPEAQHSVLSTPVPDLTLLHSLLMPTMIAVQEDPAC